MMCFPFQCVRLSTERLKKHHPIVNQPVVALCSICRQGRKG